MDTIITTDRLLLRELNYDDIDGLFALDSDPMVHEYLGNKPLTNKQQCVDVIDMVRQQYVQNGIGRWAIIDKTNGTFLGWCGLKHVQEPFDGKSTYYDLGYRLLRKFWGQGYAKEAAAASLNYGFDVIKISEIFAMAHTENIKSNRILNSLGFDLCGTTIYDASLHNWYRITHDQFIHKKKQLNNLN